MKIEVGKVHENKVKNYLVPGLKLHGSVFLEKFIRDIFKLGYGVMDLYLEGADIIEGKKPVFICIDKAVKPDLTARTVEWFRGTNYYITDYTVFGGSNRLHMLVLDYPKELYSTYDLFIEGKYSQMYSPEMLAKLFAGKEDTEEYKVLTRNPVMIPKFIKKIEDEFDVEILDKTNYYNSELDFPISMKKVEEVFNY